MGVGVMGKAGKGKCEQRYKSGGSGCMFAVWGRLLRGEEIGEKGNGGSRCLGYIKVKEKKKGFMFIEENSFKC